MAIDPSKITADVADRVYTEEMRGAQENQGTIELDGETVWWWADSAAVWFYGSAEASGDDTIKRFSIDHVFYEQPNNK